MLWMMTMRHEQRLVMQRAGNAAWHETERDDLRVMDGREERNVVENIMTVDDEPRGDEDDDGALVSVVNVEMA